MREICPNDLKIAARGSEQKGRKRRIFIISDLHVNYKENSEWVQALSLVGGDLSSDLLLLQRTFACLKSRFDRVFFVPGNHELWVSTSRCLDSMEKFYAVLKLCESMRVEIRAAKVQGQAGDMGVWIVPLFSWGTGSLYAAMADENASFDGWADDYLTKWTGLERGTTAAAFGSDLCGLFAQLALSPVHAVSGVARFCIRNPVHEIRTNRFNWKVCH